MPAGSTQLSSRGFTAQLEQRAAALAEDLDHEIREAVDDLELLAEALGGADSSALASPLSSAAARRQRLSSNSYAEDLDDPLDLVEAAEQSTRRAQEIDS